MDKELQQALAAILNKTSGAIESGVVFLQGQLPDVIHQLLMWKAVESGIRFVCVLAIAIVCVVVTRKLWVRAKEDDFSDFPFFLFSAAASFFCAFVCFENLDWLQIIVAPKIYLIEYAASLAK